MNQKFHSQLDYCGSETKGAIDTVVLCVYRSFLYYLSVSSLVHELNLRYGTLYRSIRR